MKNKYRNIIVILLIAIIGFVPGCFDGTAFDITKEANSDPNNVYIVGTSNSSAIPMPTWTWHNGVKTNIGNMQQPPFWIFVVNGNTYIAGTDSSYFPCYWTNGNKTTLSTPAVPSSSYPSSIRGMFVANSDIYIAGICYDSSNNQFGCYWKNGARIDFNALGASFSQSNAMYIVGSDVYIAGYYYDGSTYHYGYWKNTNTNFTEITVPANFNLWGILVNNSIVYISGTTNLGTSSSQACYWNSGTNTFTNLTGTPSSVSTGGGNNIVIAGTDLYISGFLGTGASSADQTACYWKNGSRVMLYSNPSTTASIYSLGNYIYISGRIGASPNRTAVYWRNGKTIDIGIVGTDNVARGIFVLPK
jgi:hypothetical protein